MRTTEANEDSFFLGGSLDLATARLQRTSLVFEKTFCLNLNTVETACNIFRTDLPKLGWSHVTRFCPLLPGLVDLVASCLSKYWDSKTMFSDSTISDAIQLTTTIFFTLSKIHANDWKQDIGHKPASSSSNFRYFLVIFRLSFRGGRRPANRLDVYLTTLVARYEFPKKWFHCCLSHVSVQQPEYHHAVVLNDCCTISIFMC